MLRPNWKEYTKMYSEGQRYNSSELYETVQDALFQKKITATNFLNYYGFSLSEFREYIDQFVKSDIRDSLKLARRDKVVAVISDFLIKELSNALSR